MERKILHIDMDAFFAAVEQLDYPAYRGKPVIIGGDPGSRGVVSTCSYEARRFGVHSAMPLREALRRCPQGIFLPVRGKRYAEISQQIMNIFTEYTPLVEPLSLDEAFLDLTGSEGIFGSAVDIARTIVSRVENELGLAASIGLAPNKFLAKLGSDLKKPKGFVIITAENALDVLENLPVGKVWGVGVKTEEILAQMGVTTIGGLRRCNLEVLIDRLGESGGQLYHLAWGRDDRLVIAGEEAKSVGHEVTFQTDTDDREFLTGVLLSLCDQVARRLRRHQLKGRIITVKIRDDQFKTLTKRTTLKHVTDFEEEIYQEVLKLVDGAGWGLRKVRLLGVSVSGFAMEETQLSLFGQESKHHLSQSLVTLHQTVDCLKNKFGEEIVTKATILKVKKQIRMKNTQD